MLEKLTGKVVHIDFGDCFEVAMHRDKFPEKIPFRLTRMLINAMEVCGIEGTFRSTCESVMRVLRDNKESVMAMLEAFVHDPLINWRLLETETKPATNQPSNNQAQNQIMHEMEASVNEAEEQHKHPSRSVRERELKKSIKGESDEEEGDLAPNTLNTRALSVINRIKQKLNGRDFDEELTIERGDGDEELRPLDIPDQVQRLIEQATSNANLCQCYAAQA